MIGGRLFPRKRNPLPLSSRDVRWATTDSATVSPTEKHLYRYRTRAWFTALKSTTFQLCHKIRGGDPVVSSGANYWRLSVRIATINPAYKLWYSYRTPMFYTLKTNPTFNHERQLWHGGGSTCFECEILASKRSSFYRISSLEYIYAAVIERAQVLPTWN